MAETRKYTRSGRRAIIDANNLVARYGENTLICAPIGALEIARVFIRQRGLWRTSYASAYNDDDYVLPDDATMAIIEDIISQFLEATNTMDCNDLITELNDIEQAINAISSSGGCGCGSGGAGSSEPGADTTDTGDITQATGTPPSGYPDWQTYQDTKCDIAHWIVQNLLDDLIFLENLTISTLPANSFANFLQSVLAGGSILALYTALVSLSSYASSAIADIRAQLQSNFMDVVCAILTGETAQDSLDAYVIAIDAVIDTAIADAFTRYLAKTALHYFGTTTQFNLLYAPYSDVQTRSIPSGQDCEDCGLECHLVDVSIGTDFGNGYYESDFVDNRHRLKMSFNATGPAAGPISCCGPMELVTLTSVNGWTATGDQDFDWTYSEDNSPSVCTPVQPEYQSDTPPLDVEHCTRNLSIKSSTAFNITITRAGRC